VHPQLGSLLIVSWTQSAQATVHVEYAFDPGDWRSSPPRALGAGAHEELVLGVPYGAAVDWRVVADAVSSPDQSSHTDPLPASIPEVQLLVSEPTRQDPDSPYWLLSLAGEPSWALIVDRSARVVWASPSPPGTLVMHPRVAADGRSLYIDRNTYWTTFDASAATVVQWRIDGTLVHEFATPGAHHPFTDLPDGGVAYGALVGYYDTEYIQIVHPDDSSETLWDCGEWLDGLGGGGYCGSNTLSYDASSDTLWLSLFSIDTVVGVDAATGVAERWFGQAPGSYSFDPPESQFWWQHGGHVTAAGTFLTSSDLTSSGVETVAREYEIDDVNQVLREVWNFGIGDGVYGQYMGEAHRLGNGNTLHNTGGEARVREATPEGEVVWDVRWASSEIGRSTPIADLYALAPDRP
ncbi:MAG: hypothetical protein ABMA64_39435, partial [Myxococcota bacterium]